MIVGDQLYPILGPLVSNRIYPMMAPESEKTVRPYIIWQVVNSLSENTDDGITGHEWARVQIDIYHDSYDACTQLAHNVIGAINDNIKTSIYNSSQQSYEYDSKLFRYSIDVEFSQTTPFS